MVSSDTSSSPYEEVNKFFNFVPSARIFGSLSSGLRFAKKFMIDEHMLVAFGVKIDARMTVGLDFRVFVMATGM